MSAVKETYSFGDENCRLIYRYAITGLKTADTELVNEIAGIMDTIFDVAEKQIEKELYKRGLMTCNAYLERIEDMCVNGNYLVQDYIKELDAKYSGKEIAYVIVCQPTELPGLYYFAGFSNVGAPRYEYLKTEACRYSSFSDAKQVAESLMTSRLIVNYTVRLDTLK
jgi:hypothetical protein